MHLIYRFTHDLLQLSDILSVNSEPFLTAGGEAEFPSSSAGEPTPPHLPPAPLQGHVDPGRGTSIARGPRSNTELVATLAVDPGTPRDWSS